LERDTYPTVSVGKICFKQFFFVNVHKCATTEHPKFRSTSGGSPPTIPGMYAGNQVNHENHQAE
jgi:hypothetical protein